MRENFIDKFVGVFSPSSALKRANARFYLGEQRRLSKQLQQTEERKYEAAAYGRRTAGWISSGSSINTENYGVLQVLRNRSRDLQQNNYWARRAVKVIANHTVGTGILPSFTNSSTPQKKLAKALFDKWQQKKYCDYDGQHNFYGLQKLVMQTLAISGEVLIRKRRVDNGPGMIPLQLQVQEADLIDTSKDGLMLQGGNFVVQGVEYNSMGKRVAYWLFKYHPGETMIFMNTLISERVPASDVLHIIEVLRPGQVRGVPMGISAFIRLNDYGDYEDAQMIRQKVAACYSAHITSTTQKSAISGLKKQAEIEKASRLEPGMITYLNPGEEITFGNPPGVPEYSDFAKNVLLGIATAWDITYEALTGDLSGSNFSSSRMGWLEMARNVSNWQTQIMIPSFCEPVYEWLDEAAQVAMLIKPGTVCRWTAPRREMFDPKKEMEAIIIAVQSGMTSWSEAARELGWDPQELLEQIKADKELMDKYELMFTSDPRAGIKGAGQPAPDDGNGDGAGDNKKPEPDKKKPVPQK